ncbi:MAG: ROK family protein [Marmoricola sp.]
MIPSIGVDIGGTKVLAAVVDGTGRVLDTEATATPGQGPGPDRASAGEVEEALVDVTSRLLAVYGRCPVGVAAAGFVDRDAQRVRFAPHLPWRDEPLSKRLNVRLAGRIQGDVLVDNDATAALWAEGRFGAARNVLDAVMITLGTGIGGGLMLRGALHRGANGMAGEFGHMQVVPDGRECQCGRRGCWEQYCSGRALARAAEEAGSELSGPALTTAAYEGDLVASAAYEQVAHWLGVGAANLTAAFDPQVVVVGGGVSAAGELLLEPARRALAESLVGAGFRDLPDLVGADLGPLAGVVGVADLARTAGRIRRVGRWGRAPSRVVRGRARRR